MSVAGSLRTLLGVVLAALALCPSVRASTWELDPAATQIAFSVRNLSVGREITITIDAVGLKSGAGAPAM